MGYRATMSDHINNLQKPFGFSGMDLKWLNLLPVSFNFVILELFAQKGDCFDVLMTMCW